MNDDRSRPAAESARKKVRSFRFFDNVPLIGDTGDPETTGLLTLFGLLVGTALLLVGLLLPGDSDAYGHVLQTAAGIAVLVGVYYTAANLRTARAEQFASRLAMTIDQLGSDTIAVQIGAIRLLEALAWETPNVPTDSRESVVARKRVIVDVLGVVAAGQDAAPSRLASEVLVSLRDQGWDARADLA